MSDDKGHWIMGVLGLLILPLVPVMLAIGLLGLAFFWVWERVVYPAVTWNPWR